VSKKILIVEDHPDVRRVLTLSLSRLGYEILEADTGGSGITLTLSESPDLVLIDLSLPDVSGLEIARAIKQNSRTAEIPLVALSGHSEQELAPKALEAGMAAYLVKPINTQRLVRVIERLTLRSLPWTVLVNPEFAQLYSVLFGLFFTAKSCAFNTLNLEDRPWTLHAD
jgi:two-component system, cell cycle response regulator DivK